MSNQPQAPHLTFGVAGTPGYFCVCVHMGNGTSGTAVFNKDVALVLHAALTEFIDIEEERERDDA